MNTDDHSNSSASSKNSRFRLLLMMCQFRPTPSNPLLNAIEIVTRMLKARKSGARLIMFGETALQGYSIFDELKNPDFYHQSTEALEIIKYAANILKIGVILGYYRENTRQSEKWANNSLFCYIPPGIKNLESQEYTQNKVLIPFEKELTENLYVQNGRIEDLKLVILDDLKIGFNICQDSWQALSQVRQFKHNPVQQVLDQKPDIFINISSSPFYLGKTDDIIYNVLSKISRDYNIPVLYLGIVGLDGGQLTLGGYSQVLYNGAIYKHMKLFEEDEIIIDLKQLHKLPETRKAKKMFSTVAQRKKRQFQSMDSAFRSIFYHLCLKHAIIEKVVLLEDESSKKCFQDIQFINNYLNIVKQDTRLYAKKGFVFHFDGTPASILLAHILKISLPPDIKIFTVIINRSIVMENFDTLLETDRFSIIKTNLNNYITTIDSLTHEKQLLGLDTFCFSDYMLGTIPRITFGQAPLGSLSSSLIYDLLEDYGLMKYTEITQQNIEDQQVVDTILQAFLQNGKDFKSVILKSFPVYYEYMSRYGHVSDIAKSFLEHLLTIYKKYHNAMNHVSNRINPSSIIQLTWYSPNRYKYVNHSLSVSDWYIRKAFESIRQQLENW